ncbi:hypothetical protein XELAEV_18032117mg [Xenopus laevis]|uniref:Uncharacterized protein n=1 Tax=Xenopus laevis TaxID=8355 RepID=A0A974CNZ9_XENLA|nr:hypothetical protein XELAEV_18032117mg [Xenopus laevis]
MGAICDSALCFLPPFRTCACYNLLLCREVINSSLLQSVQIADLKLKSHLNLTDRVKTQGPEILIRNISC